MNDSREMLKAILFLIFFGIMPACAQDKAENKTLFDSTVLEKMLQEYSAEEQRLINKDLKIVDDVCFYSVCNKNTSGERFYIATAGAPGSRKSTILERFLLKNQYRNYVYLDPDQRALKFMAHTYQSRSLNALSIAASDDYGLVQKAAYEKWRSASNYITLRLLEKAFDKKFSIVHGTTSTGPLAPTVVDACKKAGYKIVFLLCSAEDFFRHDAIEYRNREQRFYQSTPEDAVKKGLAFVPRMQFFLEAGDEIYLYWSFSLQERESLCAIVRGGSLEILDSNAYAAFVKKYEKDRIVILNQDEGPVLPSWEELIQGYKLKHC